MSFRRIDRGRSHTYELDNQQIKGVTTILDEGIPKKALVPWAARETAEFAADNLGVLSNLRRDEIVDLLKGAPWRDRDRAANRGTEVHRLADKLARGLEVDVPEELTGHVDSYLRFLDAYQPQDMEIERPVLNRTWRYAGTLDMLCNLRGRGRTLVDLKTNRSGPFGEVALQLCAYGRAEVYLDADGNEQPMPEIDSYLCVWLRSDDFDAYPVYVGEREWKTFLWAYGVGRWLEERGDRNGPDRVLGYALSTPRFTEVAT